MVIATTITAIVESTDWIGGGVIGLGILGFIVFLGSIAASGAVTPEEKVRVQQEVERISGQAITLEEVDIMLDGDPVRGVYYVKDGFDLIVEKDQT